jgi:hypothetical protein
MKKLLLLLISIPLIFGSCDKEEDNQSNNNSNTTSNIYSELYGNWTHSNDLEMTLSSNQDFTYRYQNTVHNGEWSVQGNNLTLSSNTFNMTDNYSVSGETLVYQSVNWYK